MNILLCHNHYQQPGGEDQSFDDEARLLESRGHRVTRFTVHNDEIKSMGRVKVMLRTLWNRDVHGRLRQLIQRERPHVMHCTNTFPLISPAAYSAARAERVAVVQSLRNYRLLCANALLLRDEKPCEDCLSSRIAWPALKHRCYRDDRAATAVVTLMVRGHRMIGTWQNAVDLYFTPSEFARQKFIASGFAPQRIAVKPNFVFPDPGPGDASSGGAIFVGRLSHEKGIETLLKAWLNDKPGMPLTIIGDGPMAERVKQACEQANSAGSESIEWLGRRPVGEALDHMGRAGVLICPSIAYETFGRTVVEALAKGTPAICSDAGACAELVQSGRTGLLFRTGDASDLAQKVRQLANDPLTLSRMRNPTRRQYLLRYNAQANHDMLIDIYRRAIAFREGRPIQASASVQTSSQAQHLENEPRTGDNYQEPIHGLPTLEQPEQPAGGSVSVSIAARPSREPAEQLS
jgi:glycosyltransferase involved in cell wall biosynthesis